MKEYSISISNEICLAWRDRQPLDELLSRLVDQTESKASGIWRLVEGHLELAGFGWAREMPLEVSLGFQNATRRVPLEQVGLGIVKAAVSEKPAIGRRDPQLTGLEGSASWIEKFAANTSLAVPIQTAGTNRILGVIAISTAAFVEEGDSLWQTLLNLSRELGQFE